MIGTRIKNQVDDELEQGPGFYLGFKLEQDDISTIKSFIKTQWLDNIKKHLPSNWKQFDEIGLERYHELSHLLNHDLIWPKSNRIFSKEAAQYIRTMPFIKCLEKFYDKIIVVDMENLGYEEIDWRIVRPHQELDVGPLHADNWFLQLGDGVIPPLGMKRVKVWVPLCCEPGLNGLKVVPNSQKREWRYHGEFRHSFIKPQIDENESELDVELLNTEPGDVIVFHDKLLHGGVINRGKYCRLSMEFTMFVPDRGYK